MTDLDLDQAAAALYSAVVADVCDSIGLREQTVRPSIRCLHHDGTVIGWARTFRSVVVTAPPARAYGGEIDFIDSLSPGDVVVGDASGSEVAAWGELFSTASLGRGARGVVIDGYVRDISKIRELGFNLHGCGARPTDSLGRMSLTDRDIPITVGGVVVQSGDLVVGDDDGVVVVPRARAEEVLQLSLAKAAKEDNARALLLEGGYLAEVWERFGVM